MGLLLFLCIISMVTSTKAKGAVNLSADALSIPGGYVVPLMENVTFTCNSSSDTNLLWDVTVASSFNPTEYERSGDVSTTTLIRFFSGFSIPNESFKTNPASFTFHHISLENNPSPVVCKDQSIKGESQAIIIVEGSPNCPSAQTTVTSTSLTVTIQKTQMTWLPEWCSGNVISYNESIGIVVYNFTLKGNTSFSMTSLEPGTVYNISVIPCNMAGCNKSCDIHSVQTDYEKNTTDIGPTGSNVTPQVNSIQPLLLIGVAIVTAFVLVLLVIVAAASAGCLIKWKKGKHTNGEAEQGGMKPQLTTAVYAEASMDHKAMSNSEYAVVAKGHSSRGPSTGAPGTGTGVTPLEYATVQDALSAKKDAPQSQTPLANTPSLPPFSPSAPLPCSPPGVNIITDSVQDAGYALLPDSQGSNRITKVRSMKHKADRKHSSRADSPAIM